MVDGIRLLIYRGGPRGRSCNPHSYIKLEYLNIRREDERQMNVPLQQSYIPDLFNDRQIVVLRLPILTEPGCMEAQFGRQFPCPSGVLQV